MKSSSNLVVPKVFTKVITLETRVFENRDNVRIETIVDDGRRTLASEYEIDRRLANSRQIACQIKLEQERAISAIIFRPEESSSDSKGGP